MSWIANAWEIFAARPRPRLCEIRKFSSISRFEHESQKKVASLPSLGLDSGPRFSDLSFHSQPWAKPYYSTTVYKTQSLSTEGFDTDDKIRSLGPEPGRNCDWRRLKMSSVYLVQKAWLQFGHTPMSSPMSCAGYWQSAVNINSSSNCFFFEN